MAYLVVAESDQNGEKFALDSAGVILGRHPDCNVVVDNASVSRHHAKITQADDGYYVEDLQSRNGTYLNGQFLTQPHLLTPGDRIRICNVEFEFRDGENLSVPLSQDSTWQFDGSSFGVVMVDDPVSDAGASALSKVEVKKTASGVHVAASVETKLSALLQITRTLGSALRLDEVFPKVIESLFAIFPQADRGFIVMEQPDGTLVPRWVKTRRSQGETETLRISRTIIRQAMSEQAALRSLDASSDRRFQSSESIADFRIRSMICAPLINSEGVAVGALQIDTTDQRNRFEEEDVEVLAAVAVQAGIAIHNAELHEQALQQKEVEHDLKLATQVQAAFLPQLPPMMDGLSFYSHYSAANHVGGDYYDYISLPGGKLGVVVADVVGHGVAAAMFMAKLSAETRFCLASETDPAVAVSCLNDRLSDLEIERFVTFLLVVFDPNDQAVTIVNAGHMPPVIRRADGTIEEPGADDSGLPIGILAGEQYNAVSVPFLEGDVMALYTDGINEAMNANGDQFGMEKVRRLVAKGGSGKEVRERVISALSKHFAGSAPEDDICLVVIERSGLGAIENAEVPLATTVDAHR